MSNLQYKGYSGSIEASIEDRCIHGKILFISDLVTYEAQTIDELEKEFKIAVDDYLEFCKEIDKEPEKPFKGALNVRIGEERHRKAAILASNKKATINNIIVKALDEYLNHSGEQMK
jgi:predicted HicB family RNase H-like nuclease